MGTLYEKIPENNRAEFLKNFLTMLVDRSGLGSVPKKDIEAYMLYLFIKDTDFEKKPNAYILSEIFRTKESKIKELLEVISIKFIARNEFQIITAILESLKNSHFEVESIEKGQIRFNLVDPMLFRHLQHYFREMRGSVIYSRSSEQVIVTQKRLFDVLDSWWNYSRIDKTEQKKINPQIQKIIGMIGEEIKEHLLDQLRTDKTGIHRLKDALEYGSKLTSIGTLIKGIIDLIKSGP